MNPRAWLFLLLLPLVGCSFTTAASFEECKNDVDCGTVAACSKGYCLTLPQGCRREEAGGTVAAFKQPDRIPIAALLPLSNSEGQLDDSEVQGLNAMRLAASEVNRTGIKGRPFGIFVCDISRPDGGGDEATRRYTAWMVENLQVPALIVSGSGAATQATTHPARIDAGTLIISPNATSPALSSTFRTEGNVWRVPPSDDLQARVLTNLIKADFPDAGTTRIDVIYVDDSAYGTNFGLPMVEALRAAGYVTEGRPFPVEDFAGFITPIINGLNNIPPKATVLIAFPPEVRALITRAKTFPALTRAGGHRWYLTDAVKDPAVLTPETLTELDQAIGTAPAQGAGGAFPAFRDSFRTRYGIDPNSFSFTSHSYDAMWLVMLATASAQSTSSFAGPLLGQGMGRLSNTSQQPIPLRADKWTEASNLLLEGKSINAEGSSGALDFNLDSGVPSAPYEVWQVSDGGIRVLRLANP